MKQENCNLQNRSKMTDLIPASRCEAKNDFYSSMVRTSWNEHQNRFYAVMGTKKENVREGNPITTKLAFFKKAQVGITHYTNLNLNSAILIQVGSFVQRKDGLIGKFAHQQKTDLFMMNCVPQFKKERFQQLHTNLGGKPVSNP